MNRLLLLMLPVIWLAACQTNTDTVDPSDPASVEAALKAKKTELRSLEQEVADLQKQLDKLKPRSEKARNVTTTAAQKKDFEHFVELQGAIEAEDMVAVTTEVPGRIINLTVKEGDAVNRGQLIAKIDLESIEKQISELETSLELAVDVYERQKRLWDQKIGSEIQYLQAKNNKERLEKSLETARFQLSKATVYAPISGVVENVILKSGELASPGMPIVQILDTRKIKAVVEVPETYITAIKRGSKVRVYLPALDREVTAPVTLFGKTINPANRTFKVEVAMRNTDGLLKPNLLANIQFRDKLQKDVVVVPLELLLQEAGGADYLLVAEPAKKGYQVKKHYVNIGDSYDGEVVITKGLKGGEQLIVEGVRSVADGEKVTIQQPAKTATNG